MSDHWLSIGTTVPEDALLDQPSRRLASLNVDMGGSCFDAARIGDDPGVWPDRWTPTGKAHPVIPDIEPLFQPVAGRDALLLESGQNRGFRVENAVDDRVWSVAIMWHPASPPEETRSVFAIRGAGGTNYVYLAQGDDLTTTFRDDNGKSVISLPGTITGWQAVLASRNGDRLRLWRANDGAEAWAAGLADMPDSAHLLIGARSHRSGMPKTLGAAAVGAVMLWPGTDLLAPDPSPQVRLLRAAFADYCLWEL